MNDLSTVDWSNQTPFLYFLSICQSFIQVQNVGESEAQEEAEDNKLKGSRTKGDPTTGEIKGRWSYDRWQVDNQEWSYESLS